MEPRRGGGGGGEDGGEANRGWTRMNADGGGTPGEAEGIRTPRRQGAKVGNAKTWGGRTRPRPMFRTRPAKCGRKVAEKQRSKRTMKAGADGKKRTEARRARRAAGRPCSDFVFA